MRRRDNIVRNAPSKTVRTINKSRPNERFGRLFALIQKYLAHMANALIISEYAISRLSHAERPPTVG